MTSHGPRPSAA